MRALEDVAQAKRQVDLVAGFDRGMLDLAKVTGATPGRYTPAMAASLAEVCDRKAAVSAL